VIIVWAAPGVRSGCMNFVCAILCCTTERLSWHMVMVLTAARKLKSRFGGLSAFPTIAADPRLSGRATRILLHSRV